MRTTKSLLALALAAAFATPALGAELVVVNLDAGTGAGLDDPTPRAPQGGNPGTTLGEQRQVAYAYAARMWGAIMQSDVPINVGARFIPQACTETGAVLGSAGTTQIFRDFPGATRPGVPAVFVPFAGGLAYAAAMMVAIPVSNGSLNPARSTASAIFAQTDAIGQLWLFWLAPLLGAALAGLLWRHVLAPGEADQRALAHGRRDRLDDRRDVDEQRSELAPVAHTLVDLMRRQVRQQAYLAGNCAINYGAWMVSSLLGVALLVTVGLFSAAVALAGYHAFEVWSHI